MLPLGFIGLVLAVVWIIFPFRVIGQLEKLIKLSEETKAAQAKSAAENLAALRKLTLKLSEPAQPAPEPGSLGPIGPDARKKKADADAAWQRAVNGEE